MIQRMILAGCLIAPGVAMAQLATTQMGPAKTAPALTPHLPDHGTPVKMIVTIPLPPLPDASVTLETQFLWRTTRAVPPDLPEAAPSLFVSRYGPRSGECLAFTDRIDLTAIRAHGFRLRGVNYAPFPMPSAGWTQPHFTRLDASGQELPAARIAETVAILLPTQTVRSTTGSPACRLRYRLNVYVQGPRGVNPITGARTGG